ncbi:MAG: FtsX-like permease family protein [Acidobacteriota bacterium]
MVPDIRPYRLPRDSAHVYESALQGVRYWGFAGQMIRTRTLDAAALAPAVREILRSIDPGVPVVGLRTLQESVDTNLSQPRFRALLLSAFGITALLLSVIGVFGVMAYGVVQRRQEIGVRMALGAAQPRIFRWIAFRGARLTAAGLLLGLAGCFATTRLLERYIFEMTPYDEASFVLAVVVLAASALLATYLPAPSCQQNRSGGSVALGVGGRGGERAILSLS